jgi:hypothetical protein
MAKCPSCPTAVAAIALIAGVAGVAHASSDAPVVVRVYDSSAGNAKVRAAAILTAAAITAEAGFTIEWTDCGPATQASACTGLRGPHDLIVRIMPVSASVPPGLLLRNQSRAPLGFAVVDPVVGAGAIAMVYLDRILPLAQRTRVEPGRLLGRAIAHEIGHLLIGTTAHSATGLMREVWTDQELVRNRPGDWVFAPGDRLRSTRR